jgi:hypothetical protein
MTKGRTIASIAMLAAALPMLVAVSAPAQACKVVGHKNGEPLCLTTSDATGYNRGTGGSGGAIHMGPLKVYNGQPIQMKPLQVGKFDVSTKGIIKGIMVGAIKKLRNR